MSRSANWTTLEKGIQSLSKSAIVKMIYHRPNAGIAPIGPDEVECTRPMWQKFTQNAPSSYAHSLAPITWHDVAPPTVDEMIHQLQEFEDHLTPSIISTVEKLSQELKQLRDDLSNLSSSPHVPTHVSTIKRYPTARKRRYRRYTPWATLWFYLQDHREDMKKWDGKPTSDLEERVHELKRRPKVRDDHPMKAVASVSGEQVPGWSGRADFIPAPVIKTNPCQEDLSDY
ncbi:uncharacterized protein LOC133221146 [Neopsephotus bourkii]|uniref:uncharacterized protein LOC133221146 n=1 Tax=Neopsephotus bourkii TaxID=309878 RepID=UPI002AA563DC|nr:uncharacterized protein LOC133221146 [Neopsephotus bourkii]